MRPKCPECGKELHKVLKPKSNIYYVCLECRTSWVGKEDCLDVVSTREL